MGDGHIRAMLRALHIPVNAAGAAYHGQHSWLPIRRPKELADLDRLETDGEQGRRGRLELVALEFEDGEGEGFAEVGLHVNVEGEAVLVVLDGVPAGVDGDDGTSGL